MGLMDSLKSATDFITGGAAEVSVHCKEFNVYEPIHVRIHVTVDQRDIHPEEVYLYVAGIHEQKYTEIEEYYDEHGHLDSRAVEHVERETFHNVKISVASKPRLDSGQSYSYEVEIEIPEECPEPFIANGERVYYSLFAGLDLPGNDPDSGYLYFPPNKDILGW